MLRMERMPQVRYKVKRSYKRMTKGRFRTMSRPTSISVMFRVTMMKNSRKKMFISWSQHPVLHKAAAAEIQTSIKITQQRKDPVFLALSLLQLQDPRQKVIMIKNSTLKISYLISFAFTVDTFDT